MEAQVAVERKQTQRLLSTPPGGFKYSNNEGRAILFIYIENDMAQKTKKFSLSPLGDRVVVRPSEKEGGAKARVGHYHSGNSRQGETLEG